MFNAIRDQLASELSDIKKAGTYKIESAITSAQGAHITINGEPFLNFCSNNYLGLANHPRIVEAARVSLDEHGYGL